jgi:hypothetical protein
LESKPAFRLVLCWKRVILDFYTNRFKLEGLEQWPELNGRIYDNLPSEIRRGIDRRSISYIVLLKESALTIEDEALLRQEVFERLNTGGIKLSHQEIRNALYQGKLNSLLFDLVKNDAFRRIWAMPKHSESAEMNRAEELISDRNYIAMRDVEIILRFFALRHAEHYQRGMKGFLDLYMVRARKFTDEDITYLKGLFEETVGIGSAVYGELFARPWDKEKGTWATRAHIAFSDAVMVGISRHLASGEQLIARRQSIVEATRVLFEKYPQGTFTGRGNTKRDVQDRIQFFEEMLNEQLG